MAETAMLQRWHDTATFFHLEHAPLGRIEVARAARRLPATLALLLDGSVTVTNARLLAPHLTEQNHRDVLASARHKSKRDVEEIVARLRPRPDVAASVRKLPLRQAVARETASSPAPVAAAIGSVSEEPPFKSVSVASAFWGKEMGVQPAPNIIASPVRSCAAVAPLALERYKVQCTVSRETHDKLRRAQDPFTPRRTERRPCGGV